MPSKRYLIGPLFTLATAGGILLLDRYLVRVPNPGAITTIAVVFSACIGGIASGLVAAAISIVFVAVLFSPPEALFAFRPDDLARLLIVVIATPAIAVVAGLLQTRMDRTLRREQEANGELRALRAALDQSEVGIVLLDGELRAQFINRAYRRLWQLPDALAGRKPDFADLLQHAGAVGAYSCPREQLDAYIAERARLVQAGDEKPVDIRLADGSVIRFRCKVLADGGRMLSYGNVSDLVHNADELMELATVDELTGICNRRSFMRRLDEEWKRYCSYRRPLSLLILDVDFFKRVNDSYGHDVGDQVIKFVADLCRSGNRGADFVARIGGEEFAVVLPETDIEGAKSAAERLRSAVAQQAFATGAHTIAVTISIGAAAADPTLVNGAAFVKRADEALYDAKRSGRNRVATFPNPQLALVKKAAAAPLSAA